MPITTADKRATFRKMHESGCFVLPNPWDVGSARALQHLGFKAIASTSAGFAWSIGKADNRVTLEDVLRASHRAVRRGRSARQRRFRGRLCAQAGESRRQCRARGQDRRRRVVDRGFHRRCGKAALRTRVRDRAHQGGARGDRCRQQRRVADRPLRGLSGRAGRSEHGDRPADAPMRRPARIAFTRRASRPGKQIVGGREGRASQAGQSPDRGVRPFVAEAAELGVRRISVGGSLARTAWAGFMRAAREIAEKGTFTELGQRLSRRRIEQDVRLTRQKAPRANAARRADLDQPLVPLLVRRRIG